PTLTALGIADGMRGAALFQRREQDVLQAVMFIQMVFAGSICDDMYFIPNHGRQFLQTDHHGVIHLKCSREERIQLAIGSLERSGFSLPTELPDDTFKRPLWMMDATEH